MLQRVAVCCRASYISKTMQFESVVAVCRSVLQCVAERTSARSSSSRVLLHSVAVCCRAYMSEIIKLESVVAVCVVCVAERTSARSSSSRVPPRRTKLARTAAMSCPRSENSDTPFTYMQCVAQCCSVLQCVAVCCSVLRNSDTPSTYMQCVAVCCSVLQCVAVQFVAEQRHTLHLHAVCCSMLQYVAVCCRML